MYQYIVVIIFNSLKAWSSFMFHSVTTSRQKHFCTTIYMMAPNYGGLIMPNYQQYMVHQHVNDAIFEINL